MDKILKTKLEPKFKVGDYVCIKDLPINWTDSHEYIEYISHVDMPEIIGSNGVIADVECRCGTYFYTLGEYSDLVFTEEALVPLCDTVSHPSHYNNGKIEVIDYIEDKNLNFNLGNCVKYISRCDLKYGGTKAIEDLKKAKFYLEREIALRENSK